MSRKNRKIAMRKTVIKKWKIPVLITNQAVGTVETEKKEAHFSFKKARGKEKKFSNGWGEPCKKQRLWGDRMRMNTCRGQNSLLLPMTLGNYGKNVVETAPKETNRLERNLPVPPGGDRSPQKKKRGDRRRDPGYGRSFVRDLCQKHPVAVNRKGGK